MQLTVHLLNIKNLITILFYLQFVIKTFWVQIILRVITQIITFFITEVNTIFLLGIIHYYYEAVKTILLYNIIFYSFTILYFLVNIINRQILHFNTIIDNNTI